jgi:hypothetical protein
LSHQLEKRLRNNGRVIYFSMCLAFTLAIGVLALFFILYPIGTDGRHVALAAIMGGVGALLSTAMGLRSLRIDAASVSFMNGLYGGQRMLVGVLGAIVLYVALRAGIASNMIPGINANAAETLNSYELAFVSILAGFSERLVPNLLDRDHNGANESQQPEPGPVGPAAGN